MTLTVGENTTGAPRNGEVKILTSLTGLETVVRVAQNAKNSLFDDDGNPTPRTGKILAATPMGRFGKAEELSGAVLFLLNNEAASFITGVVLPIDGGFSAYSGV